MMNSKAPFLYKLSKIVLGFVFKLYYNPKIVGKELIPKEGPIVVAGNHVHLYDQCLTILSTKRCLHYMAKREYFDNKKVAWFFKAAGCIPVDRSIKDTNATGKALEVLEAGLALGLFPEGTRNGLKEQRLLEVYELCKDKYPDYKKFKKLMKKEKASYVNYLVQLLEDKKITKKEFEDGVTNSKVALLNLVEKKVITKKDFDEVLLLPFKFGAVSMAKKTNALLVPYGITGDYKFRSKDLTARFGKPIKVGEDLEAANKKLRNEIARLMRENLKK